MAELSLDTALTPVLCIDCQQYVPFGWIDRTGVPRCPKGDHGGVHYGHRIPTTVYRHILDAAANKDA